MSKLKIAIINYDMGNIQSISNAINHIGDFDIYVTNSEDVIRSADCLILPGVGAFPDAMKKLKEKKLIDLLTHEVIYNKKPVIGICLGMQLLFDYSNEISHEKGLGWIPGVVEYIKPGNNLRVPHVGWNSLEIKNNNVFFDSLSDDKDFYFVHSLCVNCPEEYILADCEYGERITAAVQKDNIVGMQFHPEKSQKNGLIVLKKFLDWAEKKKQERNNA